MKLFISHSSKDKSKFNDLCLVLKEGGFTCWNPKVIPGTVLSEQLQSAITECPICVFIATKNSLDSAWCQAELGAFWGAAKPVIIFLTDSSITENFLPKQLNGIVHAKSMHEVLEGVKFHVDKGVEKPIIDIPEGIREEFSNSFDERRNHLNGKHNKGFLYIIH